MYLRWLRPGQLARKSREDAVVPAAQASEDPGGEVGLWSPSCPGLAAIFGELVSLGPTQVRHELQIVDAEDAAVDTGSLG